MTRKQKILCQLERFVPRARVAPPTEAQRFLLWSITHLGDVVLQLPVAAALKRALPTATVGMVVKSAFRPLVELCPQVDQIFTYDASWATRRTLHRSGLAETLRLRRQIADFEVAFIFDFHPASRLLLRSTGISTLVGYGPRSNSLSFSLGEPSPEQHRLAEGFSLLTAAEIPAHPTEPRLELPDIVRERARARLRAEGWQGERLAAVCPGSGNPQKCWPPERFAAAANRLCQNNERVLLLGSDYDRHRALAVAGVLERPALNLAGRTDVGQLAALLTFCELVLSNDSGAMHLAAALGRPLLALFGPTDPAKRGPRGPRRSVVVRSPTGVMQDLSLEQALAALAEEFSPGVASFGPAS